MTLSERLALWLSEIEDNNDTNRPLNGPSLAQLLRDCLAAEAQVAALTETVKIVNEQAAENFSDAVDWRERAEAAEAQVAELQKKLAEASRYEMDHRDKAAIDRADEADRQETNLLIQMSLPPRSLE